MKDLIPRHTAWTWRVFGSARPMDHDRDRRWLSTNSPVSLILEKRFPFTVTVFLGVTESQRKTGVCPYGEDRGGNPKVCGMVQAKR